MRRSLLWRIAIPFIVLIIISVGGISIYFSNYMEETYLANLKGTLNTEVNLLAQDVMPLLITPSSTETLDSLVQYYASVTNTRITIIAPDGRVLSDSHGNPADMENHLTRPEVSQALETGEGWEIRFSDTLKKRFYYLAIPMKAGDQIVGVARMGSSLEKIESDLAVLRGTILGAGAITIGLVIILAIVVANRTILPLRQLSREVSRLGLGDYRGHLPTYRKDEIGLLSQSFATMATRLNEQIEGYREERSKLDAILRHMTDAIIIVDAEGLVSLINPAAERIFSITSQDALGKSLVEVVRQHQVVELWRESMVSKHQEIATLETSPDRLFVQGIATPLGQSLPGNTLLVFQDLTRVRRLETVRRDFVSNVSHELRTPLASLKALTETLQEGALEDPPAAQRFLKRMDHEIDNMTQLVRELLELSRIESGKVPFNRQPVMPDRLLRSAVERMQLQAERGNLQLILEMQEDLPAVFADADRIEQVLVNLLHNAIKFTPPGGEITAQVWQEGGFVIFSVRDTGVGIPPDSLSRIFERFYKADQSRSGGGTGLGLSIARHTLEAHAGRIWAESEVNRGSTFYFSLPLA
jgi:two-component system, OmpR family, phosphate regulon sensor histidine kinase PhoR